MYSGKFLSIISLLGLLCLSACSKDNPTSSNSTGACNPATAIRRDAFVLNGNGYSNVSFNLDTILGTRMIELTAARGTYTYSDHIFQFSSGVDTLNLLLQLRIPNIASGSYTWGNRSLDSNAMGCSLVISRNYGSSPHLYKSISGGTNMLLFQTHPVLWDSIFASYCGTLKDSLGNIVTITNGTFYIAH